MAGNSERWREIERCNLKVKRIEGNRLSTKWQRERKRMLLSNKALADRAGVTVQTITWFCRSGHQLPDVTLRRIAAAMNELLHERGLEYAAKFAAHAPVSDKEARRAAAEAEAKAMVADILDLAP